MAAATIASGPTISHLGDISAATYNLTSVADTNTLLTPFGNILNVIVSVKTGGTPQYAGWTSSGGTVTFDMSGTVDLTVTILGT
jgi:hypothetical protein